MCFYSAHVVDCYETELIIQRTIVKTIRLLNKGTRVGDIQLPVHGVRKGKRTERPYWLPFCIEGHASISYSLVVGVYAGLRAFNNLLVSLPNALVVLFGLFISVHENDVILYRIIYMFFLLFFATLINLTNIIRVAKSTSNQITNNTPLSRLVFFLFFFIQVLRNNHNLYKYHTYNTTYTYTIYYFIFE